MIMRPDERAVESEIERDKNFRSNVSTGIRTVANIGTGIAATGAVARILPWLNEFIPQDLAMKGLSKVSPKLASFLKRGQSMGLDVGEGIQYIKTQFDKSKGGAKQDKNIIEQYSPELHQFIMEEIQKGRSPLEAGARATLGKKGDEGFKKVIEKMVRDHKTPWSAIIETVYGGQPGGQQKNNNQNPQMNQQQQQQQQQSGNDKWKSIAQSLQNLLNS